MAARHPVRPAEPRAEAEHAILALQWGFRLSAALLVAGLLIAVVRQDSLAGPMTPLRDLVGGTFDGDARSVITLGVLVMILTPFASTVAITATFLHQRIDRFALFGAIIVTILAISVGLSLR